jgi:hypothetical protein
MDTDFLVRPLTYRLSLITYHFLRHGFTRDAHGFASVIPAQAGIQSFNHEGHEAHEEMIDPPQIMSLRAKRGNLQISQICHCEQRSDEALSTIVGQTGTLHSQ